MRRWLPLGLLALLCLAFLGVGSAEAAPFPKAKRGKRAEVRTWKSVQAAADRGDKAATLQRAQTYLTDFPKGRHRLEAHLLAGQAARDRKLWPPCRHHLDAYLELGGSEEVREVSFQATVCRAREGKDPSAVDALRSVVINSEDPSRAAHAGRELVAYHLGKKLSAPAFAAQGLLLDRGLYDPEKDLRASRQAADDLNGSVLDAMQKDAANSLLGGLFAFLKMERQGGLENTGEGRPARAAFVHAFPDHPLTSLIPDAEEILSQPHLSGPPKVGVLLPLSGRFELPGKNALLGIEMALADLLGDEESPLAELELIIFDTEGSPEKAVEGARQLTVENEVLAILGPIIGDEAEAVGAVADELRIPMLMNSQRSGVTEGHETVFNNWVRTEEQVDAALEYVTNEWDISKFAIAYPERETAARMVERFWAGLEKAGGSVSFIESYPDGTTDFTKVARRFTGRHYYRYPPAEIDYVLPFLGERSKPHIDSMPRKAMPGEDFSAIFVPDHFRSMSMLVPGFVSERINLSGYFGEHRGIAVPIITGAASNHPDLIRRGKRFADGLLLVDSFFSGSHDEIVQRFVLQYQLLHGSRPAVLESACYDSARFLFELIEGGSFLREDLIDNLLVTAPSSSILRSTGFDENREMKHSMLVLQVEEGVFKQVYPQPPQNPIRFEVGESGLLLAFQMDEEGNKVEVPLTGETYLRMPPVPEGEEAEETEGEGESSADKAAPPPEVGPSSKSPEAETP